MMNAVQESAGKLFVGEEFEVFERAVVGRVSRLRCQVSRPTLLAAFVIFQSA